MRATLSLRGEDYEQLRRVLLHDGREAGALLRCGRSRQRDAWTGELESRFLCQEVVPVDAAAYTERQAHRMTWSTTPLYDLAKRADQRGDAIVVVHSHPVGPLVFSALDDVADREAMAIVNARMTQPATHLTMIMDGTGALRARAVAPNGDFGPVDVIRVLGARWHFFGEHAGGRTEGAFDRQRRAFVVDPTPVLRALRVGIAGCGGTGSAVATLLARLGVGHVALFDPDQVEASNLSRIHGARLSDAIGGEYKVDVISRELAGMGLISGVRAHRMSVDDRAVRDVVRACDVLFGCTDDHLGRAFLNRLAHFYLIPVVDLGVSIEPRDGGGYDAFDGRVTVVEPGAPCLVCRGVVRPARMADEARARNDPALHAQYVREGYVVDSRAPNPAVITFTTETATVAVNELLQRLTGFRGPDGSASNRERRFTDKKDADTLPGGRRREGCPLCDRRRYDGRGDMHPFLDQTG